MVDPAALAIPALSFGAVALAVYAASQGAAAGRTVAVRLRSLARRNRSEGEDEETPDEAPSIQLLREQKYSNWALLDQMIAQRSWAEREAAELTRADLPLRVGEYLLLRWVGSAGLGMLILTLLGYALAAGTLAAVGYFLPRLWVKHCQKRRR